MRIELGAQVRSFDGQVIGRVDKLVIDPSSGLLLAAVIRRGFLEDDVAVPIEWLEPATTDELMASRTADQIRELPRFNDAKFHEEPAETPNSYGYPSSGVLWPAAYPVPLGVPADVVAATDGESPGAAQAAIVLDDDSDVVTADGEKAGELHGMIVDRVSGQPDRLLVDAGGDLPDNVEVAAEHVESIDDDAIHLDLPRDDLADQAT